MSRTPRTPRGTAVVIGASVAGLSAAAVLASRFASVVIVERDVVPDQPADRKGVPQGRHAHSLLPPGLARLEGWFPRITDELKAAGATVVDVDATPSGDRRAPGPGSSQGSLGPCRRALSSSTTSAAGSWPCPTSASGPAPV